MVRLELVLNGEIIQSVLVGRGTVVSLGGALQRPGELRKVQFRWFSTTNFFSDIGRSLDKLWQ